MRVADILHGRLAAHAARWNLTQGDVNVLAGLASVGAPFQMCPTDLKARRLRSSGGISDVLSRLEKNGLVDRPPGCNDDRGSWVRPTSEGAAALDTFARGGTDPQGDNFRTAPSEALQLAYDALPGVLVSLGDDEPSRRED